MSISKRESRQRAGAGGVKRASVKDEPSTQLARLRARIPQRLPSLIPRERLLATLEAAVNGAAVTLIQAPPGYGKTSLLSQWAAGRSGDAVAW
jgi:ATP/maltotriose-dependent transcriptional regulator MalT